MICFSLVGKAGELIDRGDNTYGGKWVINPSGGLISKGHPLGATGTVNQTHLMTDLGELIGSFLLTLMSLQISLCLGCETQKEKFSTVFTLLFSRSRLWPASVKLNKTNKQKKYHFV